MLTLKVESLRKIVKLWLQKLSFASNSLPLTLLFLIVVRQLQRYGQAAVKKLQLQWLGILLEVGSLEGT
jgi:hypothetical protein